jgi:hypothetical protein
MKKEEIQLGAPLTALLADQPCIHSRKKASNQDMGGMSYKAELEQPSRVLTNDIEHDPSEENV